jgi:hypothetical protein
MMIAVSPSMRFKRLNCDDELTCVRAIYNLHVINTYVTFRSNARVGLEHNLKQKSGLSWRRFNLKTLDWSVERH